MLFTKHVTSGIFFFNSLFDYIDYKRFKRRFFSHINFGVAYPVIKN